MGYPKGKAEKENLLKALQACKALQALQLRSATSGEILKDFDTNTDEQRWNANVLRKTIRQNSGKF